MRKAVNLGKEFYFQEAVSRCFECTQEVVIHLEKTRVKHETCVCEKRDASKW